MVIRHYEHKIGFSHVWQFVTEGREGSNLVKKTKCDIFFEWPLILSLHLFREICEGGRCLVVEALDNCCPACPLLNPHTWVTLWRCAKQNNIKLSNFGFSRADMLPANGQFKRSATYCGNDCCTAPEVVCELPYVPQKSDVWSMGVILYFMASHYHNYHHRRIFAY